MAISEAVVYITDDLQLASYILYTLCQECARRFGVFVGRGGRLAGEKAVRRDEGDTARDASEYSHLFLMGDLCLRRLGPSSFILLYVMLIGLMVCFGDKNDL